MRIEQLTFTRFIAASLVMIFHYGVDVFPFNILRQTFLGGNMGVSYFFILSGFVMIIAYHHKDSISPLEYLRNRFARIYPIYFLALIFLTTYYLLVTNLNVHLQDLFLNVFMIQSWVPGKALTLNFPGWSLSVELSFYLLFPFLFNLLYRKYSYKKLIIPFFIFFAISQIIFVVLQNSTFNQGLHSSNHDLLFYSPLFHLNQFLIGNLAGLFFVSQKKKTSRDYSMPILILITACAVLVSFRSTLDFHNGLLAFLFVPLILFVSYDNGWISKLSKLKISILLGEISYGIYILQVPIFNITRRAFIYIGIRDQTIIFYGYFIVLLISSYVLYKLVEVPLRKKIKSINLASKQY